MLIKFLLCKFSVDAGCFSANLGKHMFINLQCNNYYWQGFIISFVKFNCVSSVSLTSAGNNLHFDKRFAFIVLFTTCFDD